MMVLFIALTLTAVAGYLKIRLTGEIESLSAGIVACLGLFLSLFFAPLLIKFCLLIFLVAPRASVKKKPLTEKF